ncbi:MAG: IS5 family transposase [Candidatus Aenigmarchaeota archaeon]|nr:IS5 family transposase [Candidatus Aenigmarchaeota archaeon]
MGKRKTPINWKQYNKELVRRGKNLANSIKVLKNHDKKEELKIMNKCKNGHPFEYTNRTIILFAIIKSITGMSYRLIGGFGILLFSKMPCYTQICRRINKLPDELLEQLNRKITKNITKNKDTIDLIMDGTGIMVNSTYVWIDEKFNQKRKRDWKKLHIVMDRKTKAILFAEIMDKHKNEAENNNMKDTLLNTIDNIADDVSVKKIYGDGLYDTNNNFEMCNKMGVELITRIRKPTIHTAEKMTDSKTNIAKFKRQRFRNNLRNRIAIEQIHWKEYVEKKGYGKRSGVEGVIGAFKRMFKEHACCKKDAFIKKEFLIKQITWNLMRV